MRILTEAEYAIALSDDMSERFEMFINHRFYCECIAVSTRCNRSFTTLAIYDFADFEVSNVSFLYSNSLEHALSKYAHTVEYLAFDTVMQAYEHCDKLARSVLCDDDLNNV